MERNIQNIGLNDSDIKNTLIGFIKAETKEIFLLFDRTIVIRHPSLIDVLKDDDGKLMDHLDDYLDFAEDLESTIEEHHKVLAESEYFRTDTDIYEKMASGARRIFEIYQEMLLKYGNAIVSLAPQYQIEPKAIVEDQDYRYKLISTAFPDRDHLQKLWEEIYSIRIDILLSNRKVAEFQMEDEEDYELNLSKFPTEEALSELKDQLIGLRIKYYDKVYATQLLNL